MKKKQETNWVVLRGTLSETCETRRVNDGNNGFTTLKVVYMDIRRKSGAFDHIKIVGSEQLEDFLGKRVQIIGNVYGGVDKDDNPSVSVKKIDQYFASGNRNNGVVLSGKIATKPEYISADSHIVCECYLEAGVGAPIRLHFYKDEVKATSLRKGKKIKVEGQIQSAISAKAEKEITFIRVAKILPNNR